MSFDTGFTLWLTGLPCAGKSRRIARSELASELLKRMLRDGSSRCWTVTSIRQNLLLWVGDSVVRIATGKFVGYRSLPICLPEMASWSSSLASVPIALCGTRSARHCRGSSRSTSTVRSRSASTGTSRGCTRRLAPVRYQVSLVSTIPMKLPTRLRCVLRTGSGNCCRERPSRFPGAKKLGLHLTCAIDSAGARRARKQIANLSGVRYRKPSVSS